MPSCCASRRRRFARRAGRPAAWRAYELDAGQRAVFFGAVSPEASEPVVVTVAGSSSALPGTEPGSAKVTPYSLYPAKGRATGGVRCQRFLRGEDTLSWRGSARRRPALPRPTASRSTSPRSTSAATVRVRPLAQAVAAVAGPI